MFDTDKIAALSRLRIAEDERKQLAEQMEQMVQFVSCCAFSDAEEEVFRRGSGHDREDIVRPSMQREELLSGAPKAEGDYIFVPQTVETGGETDEI